MINGVTSCTIQLNGKHDAVNKLLTNSLIEVCRQIPNYPPEAIPNIRRREGNWYVEWNGLFTDFTRTIYSNSNDVFTGYCYNLIDLIQRREVLWDSTQAASESKKVSIPAQTAIYEFIEENLGASATQAAGRVMTGTISGLSIPILTGSGPNWSGNRAWRNVLEIIQEIANFGTIDFDIVSNATGGYTFETYPTQLGLDRTTVGLDPTTGKNAAGNSPVIFSLDLENVSEITHSKLRNESKNVVVAIGQGQYGARATGIATDLTDIDGARINQRELVRNANSQEDAVELDAMAEEWLKRMAYTEDFDFVPLITESTLYGVHYWVGDKTTARFEGLEKNKRLSSVTINVGRNKEAFSSWKFETLP